MTENTLFDQFFSEANFNPVALYSVEDGPLTKDSIRYIYVNEAYERVNKVSREDVIGRTFNDVWPNVEPCWGDIILRCVREKHAVHCENESVYTDKYLEAVAIPLSDRRAATIFLDRTELKESEEKLRENQKKLLEYRATLRELATKLTLSEETTRREIASDLHDSIGHSLLGQLIELRKLRGEFVLPKDAEDILDSTINKTEQMIAESRELIFELSPPILREVGITPALEALADHLLTPNGIRWQVTTRGKLKDYNADDAVCIILYRMSRELLINVIKHAKANSVHITVNRGPRRIQVVIEDDGVGMRKKFAPGRPIYDGLGLFSIQERMLHIGGELQIVSNKQGTTVSLLAPLKLDFAETEADEI